MPYYEEEIENLNFADGNNNPAIYGANGYQQMFYADGTPVVSNSIPRPVAPPLGKMALGRNGRATNAQNNGKYIRISIANAKNADRECFLFATSDEVGLIKTVGTAFAAVNDTGGETNLTVTYFDGAVNEFLQKFRSVSTAMIVGMKHICSVSTTALTGYSTLIERIREGDNTYTRQLAIHGGGYSSEYAFRSNEITFELAQRSQAFQLGQQSSRVRVTIPASSTMHIYLQLAEELNANKAFGEGRI